VTIPPSFLNIRPRSDRSADATPPLRSRHPILPVAVDGCWPPYLSLVTGWSFWRFLPMRLTTEAGLGFRSSSSILCFKAHQRRPWPWRVGRPDNWDHFPAGLPTHPFFTQDIQTTPFFAINVASQGCGLNATTSAKRKYLETTPFDVGESPCKLIQRRSSRALRRYLTSN
jgi:hypothetical protein